MTRPRHAEGKRKQNEHASQPKHDGEEPAQHGQVKQREEEELRPAQNRVGLDQGGFREQRLAGRLLGEPALEPIAHGFP